MNFLTKLYDSRKPGNLDGVRRVVEDVLQNERQSKYLLESKGKDAQLWLDALQVMAELPDITSKTRSSILKLMLHLSKRSGLCPQCLMVNNVKRLGDFPVGGGGFGDVWKGKIGEQIVCLKVVKIYLVSDVQQLLTEYMQEAILWQQLKHPNLLPFMGMYYLDKVHEQLCLVSPWMERGNLVRFLKDTPRDQIDHHSLVYDIASGLVYLHSRKIVHGDLKGVNILLTPDERACIGDFGLSRVADSHALRLTSSTTMHSKGTTRWLAPELLKPDPPCSSSTRSDIYAFACVCYEIFTGNVPFHDLTDGAVIVTVLFDGKHPPRPSSTPQLNDDMWDIMVCCWRTEPHLRPSASEVLGRLSGMVSSKTGRNVRAAPEWNTLNLNLFWKNVTHPHLDTAGLMRHHEMLNFFTSQLQDHDHELDVATKFPDQFTLKDLMSRVAGRRGKGTALKAPGQLLLQDILVHTSANFTREFRVLLYERIILFCRDPPSARRSFAADGSIVSAPAQKRKSITIQSWTDVEDIVKVEITEIVETSPVQYLLDISWKEGDRSGTHTLRFRQQHRMRQWYSTINQLIYRPGIVNSGHGSHLSEYLYQRGRAATVDGTDIPDSQSASSVNARLASLVELLGLDGDQPNDQEDGPISNVQQSRDQDASTATDITHPDSYSNDTYVRPMSPTSLALDKLVKVKVYFFREFFVLYVPTSTGYEELASRICHKIFLYGIGDERDVESLTIDWENEELGRLVRIKTDGDVRNVFGEESGEGRVPIFHVS